jgi:hypothetical protein
MGHYMWISLRVTNSISCNWLGSVLETRYPTWSSSEVTGEKGWYVDHCRIMKIVGAVTVSLEKGGNLDLVWKALFCLEKAILACDTDALSAIVIAFQASVLLQSPYLHFIELVWLRNLSCIRCSRVLKIHSETLGHIRYFWQCLTHKVVKFRTMSQAIQAMDISIRQADRVYRCVYYSSKYQIAPLQPPTRRLG